MRVFNRYILQQMGKNLFLLTLTILLVALVAQQPFTEYTHQELVPLEANIINLGYSPDQKHLVIVTADGLNKFYIREGLRMNDKVTVTIVDDSPKTINLAMHAFSADNSLLIVGTKEGSVYGFAIQDSKVQTTYKFKKNIQAVDNQFQIKSISISEGKKIALAAGDKIVVLQTPTDQSTQFKVLADFLYKRDVRSVAWKYKDENLVLVGGVGQTGFFDLFNVVDNKPQPINEIGTTGIAVFPNGQVLQGRLNTDIMIHEWDETDKKYIEVRPIDETNNAKQIAIDSKGQYFGAVTELNTQNFVQAWRFDSKIELINLHNTKTQLTAQTRFLNQLGQHFALSGNGNELILVSNATNMVARWALCKDSTYYDDDKCTPCANNCQKCFDADTCLACPIGFYITDDNKCISCSTVTPGCKQCSDEDTCVECNTDDHWKKDVQGKVCECDTKYFKEDNTKCSLCQDKLDFCQQCRDATHCTQCYPDGNINPIPNPEDDHCVCIGGWFFDNDNVCQDCKVAIKGCVTCDNADKCTQCDDTKSFEPNGNGGCKCIAGHWLNPTSNLCETCSTSVTGCAQCQQDGKCTSCAQEKRTPQKDGTVCQCRPHTYEDIDLQCKDCDPYGQCLQCSVDLLPACSKCDKEQKRKQEPVNGICQCQKSFVQNDETHLCDFCNIPNCEDCSKVDQCEKCLTEKHFKQKPVDKVCVCQDNRHLTDNHAECLTCGQKMTGCIQCQNLKECKQCDESKNFELNGDKKQCQCKTTYFEQDKNCKLCAEQFDFCTKCNSTTCEQCHDGFSYNEEKKQCYCPDDKDFDKDAGRCEDKAGLSALAIIAIIVGILALAGGAVALIKCFKKRQSPLEDGEYEALEGEKGERLK